MADEQATEIGIVLYAGAQMASVLGMTDLFAFADDLARQGEGEPRAPLRVSHWRWEEDADAPVRIFDTHSGKGGQPAVLVLPPALAGPAPQAEAQRVAAWLRGHHERGATLGSVCTGTFVLAETGLLAGRTVTTHWTYESEFQQRFPAAHVDAARLLVDDGDILTVGGAMAWTDLALRLVDRFLGTRTMLETSRRLLIDPPGREQSYYSAFSPKLNHGDAAILKVQHWLQATQAEAIDLAALVEQSGLEERTFLRRFQKATGLTSTEYAQRLRVDRARELLQNGERSTDQVAWKVGYADPGAFRKVFARIVGLTPSEYRRRFRA